MQSLDIVKTAVKAIDSKKGEDIEVIGITDLTVLTDYFVIATATSSTQVKAISDEVEYKLDLLGAEAHHIEGRNTSWVCLDYNSVVIHIFHKQQREFYSLERLWEDGEILDTAKLLED
ncbi:MAG: ribosome silencing factor [Eubacterium sp.]|nr:ribosome silencing factor [Eubacterium sp.]MDD6568990.1 ribosome silencing factor [Eubacteriales bacterium]MDY4109279.1 ribosome silencing factor [Eubacterium sp.]